MTVQARCGLNEADDVLVDRYFHGLRIDIQHILEFKNFDNVDEIIQDGTNAEDIANYQAQRVSHLNGLYKITHLCKSLNQVGPWKNFSPGPKVRT